MRHIAMGRLCTVAILTMASAVVASSTAFADAVKAGVTIPAGPRVPVVTENGSGYTPGNYAEGTIHLNYKMVGMTFPTGPFAVFELKIAERLDERQTPAYPVSLSVTQIGSKALTLTPATTKFAVSGVGWESSTLVAISIPEGTALDPALNEDGDELVAKLQLTSDNPHLKTTTDILVKIKLVHPTACLKVYDFISDTSLANTIESIVVNVNGKGKVTATYLYGSLSHNVMVVNTCGGSETFDLGVTLDRWFSTQPNNNPGNAVFTFATAGEIDASDFNVVADWHASGAESLPSERHRAGRLNVPGDSAHEHQQWGPRG